MTNPGFPTAPLSGDVCVVPGDAASKNWVRVMAERFNKLLQGKMNIVLPITLLHDSATTTVIDARIGGYSVILLQPTTAHAAAALWETPYVLVTTQQTGQVILTHANNAQTDRNFNLVILG